MDLLQEYLLVPLDIFLKVPHNKISKFNPRELVNMFSEALKILDQDTVQYMIDDMRKEIEQQKIELDERNAEIEQLKAELASFKNQSAEK